MGQFLSSEYKLENVSEIQQSKLYHGRCLIATQHIQKGVLLSGNHGFCNDADVKLPNEWTKSAMLELFTSLKETNENNTNNNTQQLGSGKLLVLRDIYPGEEITKMYG